MPTTCEIDFENNPMKVMYAGQLLIGTVRLHLTERKKVRGIYIRLYGTAYARWSISQGKSRKFFTGIEDYLNEKTYFVGGTDGKVDFIFISCFGFCFLQFGCFDVDHVFISMFATGLVNQQAKFTLKQEHINIHSNACCQRNCRLPLKGNLATSDTRRKSC